MTATVREIVDSATEIIGEVSGPGVQTFDDDRMMNNVIRSFNLIFKKFHWQQYSEWFRFQLDGVLGIPPQNTFKNVRDFEDFISVHVDGEAAQLPRLPKHVNPYTITGSELQYWTSQPVTSSTFSKRWLQFWPKTSTKFVNVYARVYPREIGQPWSFDDTMHLDKDMLAFGAAFMALVGDDLNASAAEACKALMEMRYRDIVAGLSGQAIQVTRSGLIPREWTERLP